MRKLLVFSVAGLALLVAGCTSGTGGGDGQQVDTQAFFPNDQDNYWQYDADSTPVDYTETWTIIDDPDYLLAGQQRMRAHVDGDHDGTYTDTTIIDNETDSVVVVGYEYYEEGSRKWIHFFTKYPWTILKWRSDGLDVGDTWEAWDISGIPPEVFGFEGAPIDSIGFELDAEVVATQDFEYGGQTLTAYEIRFSGDIILEEDSEDPEDWARYDWRQDMYFVPEFGFVMVQFYEPGIFGVQPTDFYTVVDTNVPVPE